MHDGYLYLNFEKKKCFKVKESMTFEEEKRKL